MRGVAVREGSLSMEKWLVLYTCFLFGIQSVSRHWCYIECYKSVKTAFRTCIMYEHLRTLIGTDFTARGALTLFKLWLHYVYFLWYCQKYCTL